MTAPAPAWRELAADQLAPLSMTRERYAGPADQRKRAELVLPSARLIIIESFTATLELAEPREDRSDVIVLQQTSGESALTRGAEFSRLRAGDLTLIDLSRPFDLTAEAPRTCSMLWLTPDAGTEDQSSLASLGSVHIPGTDGAGALASDCLSAFVERCAQLQPDVVGTLLRSLVSIIDSAAHAAAGAEARCSRKRSFHLRRIKRFVFDHLRDPSLNPAGIAAATGVSRRYLDDLFREEETSIARFLWTRRLEGARRNLEDPRFDNRHITEIAFSWGFNSASHFSRSFGERFSMSPSQCRSRAVQLRATRTLDGAAAG